MDVPPAKDIKILETVQEIQDRRKTVLSRYDAFKDGSKSKRSKLEDSRRFQYFKRDADELESWINEKLQTASDESYKDPTNLQAKIQKHQAFEAEVLAHSNAIVELDQNGFEMISQNHYASEVIKVSQTKGTNYTSHRANACVLLGSPRRAASPVGSAAFQTQRQGLQTSAGPGAGAVSSPVR